MTDEPNEDHEALRKAMDQVEKRELRPERILEKLENAQKKIKVLKTERNELLKTNQELVNIAQELESALSKHQTVDNPYNLDSRSFGSNKSEIDIGEIDRDIQNVVETVKELRKLKNEQ